jgi:hypothetical protein
MLLSKSSDNIESIHCRAPTDVCRSCEYAEEKEASQLHGRQQKFLPAQPTH